MNKEQAIKLLRKDTNADEMYSLTKYGLRSAEIQELLQEAMDIGADALEKQVTKKVIAKKYTYFKNSTRIKDKYGKCPVCNSNQREDNYCGNCGQKLDWSEADE